MTKDEQRKFLKDVLHSFRTPALIKIETLKKVGELLQLKGDHYEWPSYEITARIEEWLHEDAKERAATEHRRKDDCLASSDPQAYNKGVLDSVRAVQYLRHVAETKNFLGDARLLTEVEEDLLELLRSPSREEPKRNCCGSDGGRVGRPAKSCAVQEQQPQVHPSPEGREEDRSPQPAPTTSFMGKTLHDRLMDFGQNFDVQLIFFTTQQEFDAMVKGYPAEIGWTIDPTVWFRKSVNGTTNVRIAYRQVVQP